jgi:hypothetical protein
MRNDNAGGNPKKGADVKLTVGPIYDMQTLQFRRSELFRDFEDHPGRLALAKEIKIIDDKIAGLNAGKKKAGVGSSK